MWIALSFLTLGVVAGLNLVRVAQRVPVVSARVSAAGADVVMQHERRLAAVRDVLRQRAIRGVIGYVTDVTPSALPADGDAMQGYFLTQFVLAPCVVEAKFADCAWAVTDYRRATERRVPDGFRVVQDFGDGVSLLQRSPP